MQDDVKNNEIEQQDGVESTSETSSRRKFIKKTAVGGILTTLPATSVWGICRVSGALSGGSQHVDECNIPVLTGGRSPGFWKPEGKFHGGFSAYKNKHEDCIHKAIVAFQKATTIELDTGVSMNLYNALYSNGTGDNNLAFHLAAAYLNAYYGFYSLPININSTESITTAEELVQHLYAATFAYSVADVIRVIESSYDEGTSAYSSFSC